MALRDLMFRLSFQGNTSGLQEMDSSVDSLKGNVGESIEQIDGMSEATERLGTTSERQGNIITRNWLAITAGLTAVSLASEKFTRDNAKMSEALFRISRNTKIAESDLKSMALELTSVSTPLQEITAMMEIGSQQGIKSIEELAKFTDFWSTVGDATGLAGDQLAKAGSGLRAVGISAGEEEKALKSFGYVTQNTTSDVNEFLQFLERTGVQLRSVGMDIDDASAMLGLLEQEFGMSGRIARTEFRKAVNDADGDMNRLLRTLGVSVDTFEEYRRKVDQSGDVIQENADRHMETYTATQRLGQSVKELGFRFEGTLRSISSMAPALMLITPMIKLLSVAKTTLAGVNLATLVPSLKASAVAMWTFTASLLANPITWVVVGIVALSVAIWALWNDVGGVTTKIKNALGGLSNWLKRTFGGVVKWIKDFPRTVRQSFTNAVNTIKNVFGGIIDWFKELPSQIYNIGKDIIQGLIDGIMDKFNALKDTIMGIGESVSGWFKGVLGISSPSTVFSMFGIDTMDGFAEGMKARYDKTKAMVTGLAGSVGGWFKDELGISSPSKVMIEAGLNVGEGVKVGIRQSERTVERASVDLAGRVDRNISTTYHRSDSKSVQGNFAPVLNINITESSSAKATAMEVKKQWERMMSQYNRRNNLRWNSV